MSPRPRATTGRRPPVGTTHHPSFLPIIGSRRGATMAVGNDDRFRGGAARRPTRVRGGGRRGRWPYPPPPGTFARAAGGATSPPQYTPRSPLSRCRHGPNHE
jgi:hypothetical protein